ncbi:MAG: ABC transporter ATP-binding protein [Bacillales bacterium]
MFIEIKNICKDYGEKESIQHVLKKINFSIDEGEIIILLGPSGSGKTTLLNIIGGIENANKGSVLINNEDICKLKEKRRIDFRRKYLGYIFQSYNLISNLTTRENIEVGKCLVKNGLNTDEVIEVLGLKKHENKIPSQMSGGQQQRVSIGRAIIKKPALLLCDEPTGALDSENSIQILKFIEKINKKYKTSIIFVTHNEAISQFGDRIIRLKDGKIVSNEVNKNKKKVEDIVL